MKMQTRYPKVRQASCQMAFQDSFFFSLKALRALHLKLSVWPDEAVSPQDGRLQLVKTWLEVSPGAQDVFDAWERAIQVSQFSESCFMLLIFVV